LLEGCPIVKAHSERAPGGRAGTIRGLPGGVLLACEPFRTGASAERVGDAVAAGLRAGGVEGVDVLPLPAARAGAGPPHTGLDAVGFDARMRAVRAVVIAADRLSPHTLAGSAPFEVATRARQGGVPAYAIARANELGSFEARMLDLQVVLQAAGPRALANAGRKLAAIL
jgi:glycerate kinase